MYTGDAEKERAGQKGTVTKLHLRGCLLTNVPRQGRKL